jgi:hypothetical protein
MLHKTHLIPKKKIIGRKCSLCLSLLESKRIFFFNDWPRVGLFVFLTISFLFIRPIDREKRCNVVGKILNFPKFIDFSHS